MQWRVDGAERQTGSDRTVIVEAENGLDATAQAEAMSLLVSSCRKATSRDVLDFLSPGFTDDAPARSIAPKTYVPPYKEIQTGADSLRAIAIIALAVGALQFVGGVVAMSFLFQSKEPAAGFVVAAGVLCSAALWVVVATVLRMFGSLALAVRDIARNSYGQR
jgi:hypothetical protein